MAEDGGLPDTSTPSLLMRYLDERFGSVNDRLESVQTQVRDLVAKVDELREARAQATASARMWERVERWAQLLMAAVVGAVTGRFVGKG